MNFHSTVEAHSTLDAAMAGSNVTGSAISEALRLTGDIGRTRIRYPNPWGISQTIGRALDAILREKCQKRAAASLGIPIRTLESRVVVAKERMNVDDQFSHLIKWYEWSKYGEQS